MVVNKLSPPPFGGFRQCDSLSCDFFNILMDRIIWSAGLRHSGTIFYKSVMPLAYADDLDIIGRSDCEVEVAFSKFAEEARNIGLAVNERSTVKASSIEEFVEIDGYSFEVVKDFVYLGSSINTDNAIE